MDLKVARATVLEKWKGIKATTARVLFAIGARRGTPSIWDRVRFGNGLRRASKLRPGGNSVGLAMRRQSPNRAAASQRGTRTVWPGVLLLLFTGCGSPPDLRDPETLDRILAEAVDVDVLQRRGDDNIVYAPNESEPYSGWAKSMRSALFDLTPQLAELHRIDAGILSSRFEWHENGQMEREEHYEAEPFVAWNENDQEVEGYWASPTGRWVEWYSNGQMEQERHYEAGERTGRWVAWHENGQMASEGHYEAGEPTGRRVEWYRNGQMEREEHYEAGERTGRWVAWDSDGEREIEFDYDSNSFTVGNSPVAQLPLRSSGPISADTQFVFETAPGCTRVEVEGSFGQPRNTFAILSNVWTGETAWVMDLRRRGETYSHTINDARREHYRLHLNSHQPSSYQLEVAATNCDD